VSIISEEDMPTSLFSLPHNHLQQVETEATSEEDMPYLLQAVRPPSGDRNSQAMRKKAVTPTAAYYMRAYVSRSVLACVDTGLMDWIRELRQVVVVFANLPDLDDFESEDFLPTLQLATEILQTEITRFFIFKILSILIRIIDS
jgi:hypothetical protein